ncbi:hypothetical protein QZH41_014258 [Actinostola sp. cb2023]|nr:hypothetical protein QZH41_014258 [Actinostola sp. cb2023]
MDFNVDLLSLNWLVKHKGNKGIHFLQETHSTTDLEVTQRAKLNEFLQECSIQPLVRPLLDWNEDSEHEHEGSTFKEQQRL